MDISSASQQFAVAEQKTVAYGRKQQLLSKPDTEPQRHAASKPVINVTTAIPRQPQADPSDTDDVSLQTDDKQVFNAFQTVGMVKRILAQLSAHTADWLDKPLVSEFNGSNTGSAVFSAQISQQSVWISSSQSHQSPDAQWLTTQEWEMGYQAIQANFSGELTLDNGNTISFALDFSMELSWARYSYSEQRVQDPLLVSLSGSPVQLSDSSTAFDLLDNGNMVKLPQLAAQQYYLAYDKNADNQVNNGSELFGPQSGSGFAELAKFDDNGNGFIDPSDDIWQYLYLWRPEQSLLSMQQASLGAISIDSVATKMPLQNSRSQQLGELQRSGVVFTEQGKPALVQQIDLVV